MNWFNIVKQGFDINKTGNVEIFIQEVEEFIETGTQQNGEVNNDSKKYIEQMLRKLREMDIAHLSQPSIASYGYYRPHLPEIEEYVKDISKELEWWVEPPFKLSDGGDIVRR
jgi:hypothetical protein